MGFYMNLFELNWIAKKTITITKPVIAFENIDYGGCYYPPSKCEILVNDRHYTLDKGLIIINPTETKEIVNCIAHEWRHHLQFMTGIKPESIEWDYKNGDYEQSIIDYFTKSKTEMDALLYSNKYAPSELSILWQQWIFKNSNKFIEYSKCVGIKY